MDKTEQIQKLEKTVHRLRNHIKQLEADKQRLSDEITRLSQHNTSLQHDANQAREIERLQMGGW